MSKRKESVKQKFPRGWNEQRVRKVIEHYENQTEEEQLAEHEALFGKEDATLMSIPTDLVSAVQRLLDRHKNGGHKPRRARRRTVKT